MVSQLEVARAAGVSTSTVSLALNNHPRVSPRTALHVQRVARELGYVPNHAARQLIQARFGPSRHREIRQIGVVSCIKATPGGPLNPTDMAFLNGVEQGVADRSGVLVYLRQSDDVSASRLSDLTRAGTVEGWIAFGRVGDEEAALLDSLKRPWVVLGDHACSQPPHQVNMDFRLMGRLAARHLARAGHRRIGLIGPRMHFTYAREILAGFQTELAEAGLPLDPAALLLREGGTDPRPWLREALMAARRSPEPPTAFVYAEPGESAAALSVTQELGIRVPGDLSLICCEMTDGLPFVPGVARVESSAVEAGRAAVSLLADVADRPDAPARQVLVAPQLTPGWSSAGPESIRNDNSETGSDR